MNNHLIRVENIAKMLKDSRQNSGKTQKEMAKALNRSVQTIQNWESGYSIINVIDFQSWFEVIGINPFRYILNYLEPVLFGDADSNVDDTRVNEALSYYLFSVAPMSEKRKLAYCIFGHTGSAWSSQLDMLTAHNLCTLRTRVNVSRTIYDSYLMEEAQGLLNTSTTVRPDLDNLKAAIDAGQESVIKGHSDYIQNPSIKKSPSE